MLNKLRGWLNSCPELSSDQQQRLAAWKAMPKWPLNSPLNRSRCVVVDVETSGLNLMKDRLISIGAIAVVDGKISLGDSFSVVLKQTMASDKQNILLHGIGGSEQTEGVLSTDALLDFLDYLGNSPLIAFHVTFDQTMIQRAMRQFLCLNFKHSWHDMAYVMPSLNPVLGKKFRSLDDWIDHFGIINEDRHNALSDALVTAQLYQVAISQARLRNVTDLNGFVDLEKAQRWVDGVN
jgi:DNA polymerase-3 subunit epsilon